MKLAPTTRKPKAPRTKRAAEAKPRVAPLFDPCRVSTDEIRTKLPQLLARVRRGETLIVVSRNRAVARLTPLPPPRPWGTARGEFVVPEDFDARMVEFPSAG